MRKPGTTLKTWTSAAIALIGMMTAPALAAPEQATTQNWYESPILPLLFQDEDAPEFRLPPPLTRVSVEERRTLPTIAESEFPRLMSVIDIQEWREKDSLRFLRERAGDTLFGIPLLVPQLLLEEFIPRGLAVGPNTYLYRDSKDSRSMPLVVFDQAVFHESEFLAQVQARGDAPAYADTLTQSQRHVLRRALGSGFRATYALPSMSLDLILDTASEQGFWGYVLLPAAGSALLFLKGVDQRFSIDDVIKARIQVTSGRQWMHAVHSTDGSPALNCELKVANFPVALIVSFEMSDRGMTPQFVGIGTSLDVVQDLLGREENRGLRPNQ